MRGHSRRDSERTYTAAEALLLAGPVVRPAWPGRGRSGAPARSGWTRCQDKSDQSPDEQGVQVVAKRQVSFEIMLGILAVEVQMRCFQRFRRLWAGEGAGSLTPEYGLAESLLTDPGLARPDAVGLPGSFRPPALGRPTRAHRSQNTLRELGAAASRPGAEWRAAGPWQDRPNRVLPLERAGRPVATCGSSWP